MNMLSKKTQDALYKLLKGEPCDFIIAVHPHDDDTAQIQGGGNILFVKEMIDHISSNVDATLKKRLEKNEQ